MMTKLYLVVAVLGIAIAGPLRGFSWETATSEGREYVTLQSFCAFYGFSYAYPGGNNTFETRNASHWVRMKLGSPDMILDGVHYVMSFPIAASDHDWLVSRMDVIKLFEPVIRPTEIDGRHAIRGVVIDAGHGGTDNGAVSGRGGMEKNYTIDTAFRLEAILRAAGLRTVLTRRTDVFVDLYERAHIASLYPDYCFVSIHYNSASAEARGLETYCLAPRGAASTSSAYLTRSDIQRLPGNDEDAANLLLASMVHSEIIRLNPGDSTADRGVKRARFVVIKQNVLPAILVEGGFVSNRMEAARVNTSAYRQTLAEAIGRGVIRFINSMGDRHLALPGSGATGTTEAADAAPAPRAVAVPIVPIAPPAPSGLASDQAGHPRSGATAGTPGTALVAVPASSGTSTAANKKHHKKPKTASTTGTSSAPGAISPSAAAPATTTSTPTADSSTTSSTPGNLKPDAAPARLDLAEPKAPEPTAVPDKPSAEPDEPPTVNIYNTKPDQGGATATTNAPSSGHGETTP